MHDEQPTVLEYATPGKKEPRVWQWKMEKVDVFMAIVLGLVILFLITMVGNIFFSLSWG